MTGDATTTRRRVQVMAHSTVSEGVEGVDARLLAAIHSAQRARSIDLDAPFALLHFSDAGLRLHLIDGPTGNVLDGRDLESITPTTLEKLIADHLVDTGRVEEPENDEWRQELLELSKKGRMRLASSDGTFIMGREHVRLFRVSRRDVDNATRDVMARVDAVRQEMASGDAVGSFILTSSHIQWPGLRAGLIQLSRLPLITIDDPALPVDIVTRSDVDDAAATAPDPTPSATDPTPSAPIAPAPTPPSTPGIDDVPRDVGSGPSDMGQGSGVVSGAMDPHDDSSGMTRSSLSSAESGDFPATQLLTRGQMFGDDTATTGPVSLPLSGPAVRPSVFTTAPAPQSAVPPKTSQPPAAQPPAGQPLISPPSATRPSDSTTNSTPPAAQPPMYEYPQAYEQVPASDGAYANDAYSNEIYNTGGFYANNPGEFSPQAYGQQAYVQQGWEQQGYVQQSRPADGGFDQSEAQYAEPQRSDIPHSDTQYTDAQYSDAQYSDAQYAEPQYDDARYYGQLDYRDPQQQPVDNVGTPGGPLVTRRETDDRVQPQMVVRSQSAEPAVRPNVTVAASGVVPDESSSYEEAAPAVQRAARWEPTSWDLDPDLSNPARRGGRGISFNSKPFSKISLDTSALKGVNKRVVVSVAGICVALLIATVTVMGIAGGDDGSTNTASPTSQARNTQTTSPYADPADLNAARMPVVLYTPPAPPPQATRQEQARQAPANRAPARPRPPARRSIPNPIPGLPPILLP